MGVNNLQNAPLLISATSNGSTSINGTLDSTPDTTFRIEFFGNSEQDASGFGEGETFLGSVDVTTDASGNASFSPSFPVSVATPDLIRRQIKQDDMMTLQKDGLRLVAEGLTSLEELQRSFKS